jgi:hypothetical protein
LTGPVFDWTSSTEGALVNVQRCGIVGLDNNSLWTLQQSPPDFRKHRGIGYSVAVKVQDCEVPESYFRFGQILVIASGRSRFVSTSPMMNCQAARAIRRSRDRIRRGPNADVVICAFAPASTISNVLPSPVVAAAVA